MLIDNILEEIFRQSKYALDRVNSDQFPIKDVLTANIAFSLIQGRRETRSHELSNFLEFVAYALPLSNASYSQLAQDCWVIYMMPGKRSGVFVEIGAGDGVYLSNTKFLEESYGWSGILCEPNPNHHGHIESHRTSKLCKDAIVGIGSGTATLLVTENSYLSRLEGDFASDLHDALGNRRDAKRIEVQTLAFDLMCEQHELTHIDFLSVDTEGSELSLLKGISLDRWRIPLVCVEHNHTTNALEIYHHMLSHGYKAWLSNFTQTDYFFFHPEFLIESSRRDPLKLTQK
jgi:FkbM family methyltransferase